MFQEIKKHNKKAGKTHKISRFTGFSLIFIPKRIISSCFYTSKAPISSRTDEKPCLSQ